jgi:hypothetical protein
MFSYTIVETAYMLPSVEKEKKEKLIYLGSSNTLLIHLWLLSFQNMHSPHTLQTLKRGNNFAGLQLNSVMK